jgi:hypothetical protein
MKKGFSDELNRFLIMFAKFRKDNICIPKGVYKFKTLEDAEKWRMQMLRGNRPDSR